MSAKTAREVTRLEDRDEVIRLRVPAEQFSRQLIRLAVYLVASRMDFDLTQLDDLRIAIDEASNYAVIHSAMGTIIEVEVEPGKEYLEIVLSSQLAEDGEPRSVMPESFSRMIMESVVDGVDLERKETTCRISLRKRCPE
jgi:anti-sigma regulatory factor (Ser/Thr protein kinase)